MKSRLFITVSAVALASLSAPAVAQMSMPVMTMPMAEKKRPPDKTAKPKQIARKAAPKTPAHKHSATLREPAVHARHASSAGTPMPMANGGTANPAGQSHGHPAAMSMAVPSQIDPQDHTQMPSQTQPGSTMQMTMPPQSSSEGMRMRMGQQPGQTSTSDMHMGEMSGNTGHEMQMRAAALGAYPEQRESSGTSWQPDSSIAMNGPMLMSRDWTLMAHGTANLLYDHQSGPRGDDKTFVSGMLMAMARHPLGSGAVQFRAMLSPDPLMGPSGYPLLLASGETADGRDRLIDRQHPHDFFMELSASASQNIGPKSSVFLYAGLPGEPAFGPPAFMHRESILDSPEAPISHHWLDSTHITFGVITAGVVLDRVKVEASQFNAREPDQHRWNIETGPLDSTSVRASWNPLRTLSLQASWAQLKDPEQLEPGVNQTRWSASALWANDPSPGWHAAATLAWGRKSSNGHNDDGFAAEASIKHLGWTVFGRAEQVENRELLGSLSSSGFKVGKVSLGAVRDFQLADHLAVDAGGLFSLNFVPHALASFYGSRGPTGMMGFLRLKLN